MNPLEFHLRCAAHDWTHDNSDDHSRWNRGQRDRQELRAAAESSPELAAIWHAWNAHAYHRGAIPQRPDIEAVSTFPGAQPAHIPGQLSLGEEPTDAEWLRDRVREWGHSGV